MTTEIKLLSAPDVYVYNDVFVLGPDDGERDIKLAGATWLMQREPVKKAHLLTMRPATALAMSKLPGYSLWLLAGMKVWQPESRITRYRNWKLWGALKASDLVIPPGRDIGEFPVEVKGGLHYFGALQLEPDSLEAVVKILEPQSLAHLVALHPDRSGVIEALIRRGWELPRRFYCPSWEVLKTVCGAEGVVFWTVGQFDDIEAGTVAFASPSIIERMLDNQKQAEAWDEKSEATASC